MFCTPHYWIGSQRQSNNLCGLVDCNIWKGLSQFWIGGYWYCWREGSSVFRIICETWDSNHINWTSNHFDNLTNKTQRPMKLSRMQHKYLEQNPNCRLFPHIQDFFDENFFSKGEHVHLIQNCSIIIGMHPDQVTELIIDTALAHKKEFAVVPCCVFHRLFPERMHNEKPVLEYETFVEYLMAKDPRIQLEYLNMKGRNKVIFTKHHLKK